MGSGSVVECPHCRGTGYRDHDRVCAVCSWGQAIGIGVLFLPVDARQAEYIYENADRAETEALVQQSWDLEGYSDCPECTVLRLCDDCYTEAVSW